MTALRIHVRKTGGWWYWDCPYCGRSRPWAAASRAADDARRHLRTWHALSRLAQ